MKRNGRGDGSEDIASGFWVRSRLGGSRQTYSLTHHFLLLEYCETVAGKSARGAPTLRRFYALVIETEVARPGVRIRRGGQSLWRIEERQVSSTAQSHGLSNGNQPSRLWLRRRRQRSPPSERAQTQKASRHVSDRLRMRYGRELILSSRVYDDIAEGKGQVREPQVECEADLAAEMTSSAKRG
jgi:hypothetical protein